MGVVLVLALVVYFGTRQFGPGPLSAATPNWGPLTLSHVALDASRAAGEPHPTDAVWVSTIRMDAVPYLTGRSDSSAEADYLVALRGTFHLQSAAPALLPGSLPRGSRLVLLVRGFDGKVTGRMITNRALAHLRTLGVVNSLPMGLGLL